MTGERNRLMEEIRKEMHHVKVLRQLFNGKKRKKKEMNRKKIGKMR